MKQPEHIRYPHTAVRFELGNVVATPGALDLFDRAGIDGYRLLARHQCGDWGDVPPDDADANEEALMNGCRVLSSYTILNDERIWVITEADRSVTTLLLPDEY